ncbi:APC family permease [Mycolicibacterium sp. P9-22]|uniref:APC family permease n=1 Tax=Mycolicibacterium sp. P9-22 TaxID=2024613 RepID=UPI0011EF6362|nr:APC family permease [Mycolicibacterium sp. P9-22]KAA0109056.1 APC family permease [Mycolicibacterium sp. P9-22]
MTVLAFSSPLTTVAGFIPVLLSFDSRSAPAIYLLVAAILLVFSVGFTAMARKLPNPGGFYAFVTAGLGRPAGLGGAFLAIFGYVCIGFFAPPFFAVTVQAYVVRLGGPEIPWIWYGLGIVLLTTAFAYRRIDLSARVLTVVMGLEIVAVVIFNVAAFVHGGPADGGGAAFALPNLGTATIGLAILFAAGNFLGFEATVIYREEVKDPTRTIPRATYLAVAGIGVFYAIAAWAYLTFFGANNAQAAATEDTAGMFNSAATALLGSIFVDVVTVLLMTSVLAAVLSIHNVAARYLFSLGSDSVLPAALGKVHHRHHSPHVSAAVVGALWATATVLFVAIGTTPESLYGKAVGIGTLAIVILMFSASIAVIAYFWARRDSIESVWKCFVAPVIAAIGIGFITYLAIANYPELLADTGAITAFFLAITFAVPVAGAVYAGVLRKRRPEVYSMIGRQQM